MKAVILESYVMEEGDLDWSGVKALVPDTTSYVRTDYADIAPRIGDAELVLINKCRIDEAVLAQCPSLKWVGIIATGTDNIDLDACRRREFFGACGLNRPLCIKCRLYISDRGCLHLIFGSRLRLKGLIEKRCHKRNYNYRN